MSEICPTCGDEFSSDYGVKQHHAKTHGESISGEPVDCDNCGETVRKKKGVIEKWDNHFCSDECRFEYTRGEDHPDYERVDVECDWCGETAEKHPRTIRRDQENFFCGMECRNEYYRSGIYEDSRNPNWKGGFNRYYGYSWSKKREEIMEMDDRECQRCGVDDGLHVHHIIPKDEFSDVNDAHYYENLVTLCWSCHPELEKLEPQEQVERLNVPRLDVDV